ncbi:hypothetical protein ACFOKI_11200 [Sphingomonas qilianensis]|uniref:Uncharacterized protein n=1 Tax=Sphingomonas qilianensis TaxID=1736690 RepID=A0ABU9XPE0_9SPHN
MTKFLTAALLAAIAIPAVASAEEAPQRSFTRDGQTFVYTSVVKDDKTVLSGHAYPSGRDFTLSVRGKRVRGYAGGVPVSFVAESALPRSTGTALASR